MSNNTLKVFSGILVVAILTILLITFSIDRVIKSGIEENSSELLQTKVTVDKVSISLFGGSGIINGLTIHNPKDFSEKPALLIQEASIKVDLSTLLSDQVIVNEIIINRPEVFFEQKGMGINLKKLSDNMDESSNETSKDSKTMLVIDHLQVLDGKIIVSSSLKKDRTTEVSLSAITLNDIGRNGNNTVKQSVEDILRPLFQKAIENALKSGVTEQLEDKVRNLFDN